MSVAVSRCNDFLNGDRNRVSEWDGGTPPREALQPAVDSTTPATSSSGSLADARSRLLRATAGDDEGPLISAVVLIDDEEYGEEAASLLRESFGPSATFVRFGEEKSSLSVGPRERVIDDPRILTEAQRLEAAMACTTGEYVAVLARGGLPLSRKSVQWMFEAVSGGRFAVVGPSLLGGTRTLAAAGWAIDSIVGLYPWFEGRDLLQRQDEPPGSPVRFVSAVPAECWVMRRSAWEALGPFDPKLDAPWAEADWCMRAWKAGWLVGLVEDAEGYAPRLPRTRSLDRAFAARWGTAEDGDPFVGHFIRSPMYTTWGGAVAQVRLRSPVENAVERIDGAFTRLSAWRKEGRGART